MDAPGTPDAGNANLATSPARAAHTDTTDLTLAPACRLNADRLAGLTARAAGAPVAVIFLMQGATLEHVGHSGLSAASHHEVETTGRLARHVVSEGLPLVLDDVDSDRCIGESSTDDGPRSYAGFPIRSPDGEVVGACGVLDYRPRVWTTEELASVDAGAQACTAFVEEMAVRVVADRQRRFLDALLDSLQVGVAACDAEGRGVLANAAAIALGVGPGREPAVLARALAGERLRDVEFDLDTPDRGTRTLLTDAQQIVGEDGRALGAVVAIRDVTDARRAERFRGCELAVSTALAEAHTVEAAGPGVLKAVATSLDWPHGELWMVEHDAQVLRSVAIYDAPGTPALTRVPAELRCGHGLAGAAAACAGVVWVPDLATSELVSANTAMGMRSAVAVSIPTDGRSYAVLTFFTPMAEERQDVLVALLAGIGAHVGQFLARRRAEELELELARSKDEYLSLIGHEMRTPLTSIVAYTDLLRELDAEIFESQGRRMLDVLRRNSDQLRHIVDQLLDLAALDTGHATISARPVDLVEIVRETVAAHPEFRSEAFDVQIDAPRRCMLPGDPLRLRQVVDALIGNAIIYSPDGGRVEIEVRRSDRRAELTVTDSGIGIPDSEGAQLFGRFYRSSRARDHQIPGVGLALTVSRAIVERHGGSIALLPSAGVGTSVRVRLPLDR